MAPLPKVNLAYMHFTHVPKGSLKGEGLPCYRRLDAPAISDFIFSRYEWAKKVVNSELTKLSRAPDIKYYEWRFESCCEDLFEIDGTYYEKFIIFLGEDLVHWHFYSDGKDVLCLEGQADLELTYCCCCLQTHYKEIIYSVKDWITANKIKPKFMTLTRPAGSLHRLSNGLIA